MTLLSLCVRWLYWRIRVARQERAPRPLGALTRAWVRLWCHPVATLRLDALWTAVKTCGRVLGNGVGFVPVIGPLAGEGFVASVSKIATGLGGPGLNAHHHQAEALRDSLARLQAQRGDPLRSGALAQMLANQNRS